MCKILVIPRIDSLAEKQVRDLVRHVSKLMTERDADGFGYAYLGDSGIYAERFLDTSRINPMLPSSPRVSFLEPQSECHGVPSKPVGGLIVHARTSTNKVSLGATHPFIQDGRALIHNGVVSNLGESVDYPSGNDSEMLFQHYLKGGIDRVSASVAGYYAVGILDERTKQTVVFKDATARLYGIYVKAIKSYAFATTPEILSKVAGFFKEKCRVLKFRDNTHLVFNASGRLVSESTFTPIERSFGALDYQSLGYSSGVTVDEPGVDDTIPDYRLEHCDIEDAFGRPVSFEEFSKMSASEQDECRIRDGHKLRYGA
jgi:predicted glutamine amidotransferase